MKRTDRSTPTCDFCGIQRNILAVCERQNRHKNLGKYRCANCRPQCKPEFWQNSTRKLQHANSIKSSTVYYDAIKHRITAGTKNGMFGRKHSETTKTQMSQSRTGKLGTSATAWKGGKFSLLRRLKKSLQTRFKWFSNVLARDNYTCQRCGAKSHLDAHHITPISSLVKTLLTNRQLGTDDDKLIWLLQQPEILDSHLVNGIALCRACHKNTHHNWGSHVAS